MTKVCTLWLNDAWLYSSVHCRALRIYAASPNNLIFGMVKSNSHWYLENLMPKHPVQGIKVENVGNAQTRFPRQMFDLSLYGLEQEAIRPQYYEALFHEVSLPCQNQSLENEFWKSDIRRSGVGKGLKCDIWRSCLCGLPLIHLTLLYAEDSTGFFNPGLPALQMLLSWHGGEVETFETAKHIFDIFSHDLHMPSFRTSYLFKSWGSNEELWVFPAENHLLHSPSDLLELTLPCSSSW